MPDAEKLNRTVDNIAQLDIEVAVGAHTPAVRGKQTRPGIAMMRELPGATPAPMPGQAELEAMIAKMAGHG